MGLFTVPHHAMETCAELKGFVTRSWQKVLAGEPWKRAKKRFGIVGYIRALEITQGVNGWHPHIHSLFLTGHLTDAEMDAFRGWLGERWASAVKRLTGKTVNLAVGYNLQRACSIFAAGDYVAKWGVDSEITKAHLKISKKGGKSPWQLLFYAGSGDKQAWAAFREYASAMKGSRHLTWSRGLRNLYVYSTESSDEELAKVTLPYNGDQVLGTLQRPIWQKICSTQSIPKLLNAAEVGGWRSVERFLGQLRPT